MVSPVDQFYNNYYDKGFFFPVSVLSTYALSLNTKPFVLLSGISGTGKTKIAQLFDVSGSDAPELSEEDSPILSIKIPESLERFNFAISELSSLFEEKEEDEFNSLAEKAREDGNDGNFSPFYVFTVEDEFGEFQFGLYGQRASSPLIRGRLYKSRNDRDNEPYDARDHIKAHYNEGDVLGLEKIGPRKFRVISSNDEPTIKRQRKFELAELNRHCFISVKSDWTDTSSLLGFYNLIEQKYHVPSFLSFLMEARDNPEYPYFVIFDEMNLSKVEHYFSDILSCMESRYKNEEDIYQEKITLHHGSEVVSTDSDEFETIPTSIELPLNLYITGTVNVDESTYMFSPKVLDRANVIEFNEVDLEKYEENTLSVDTEYKLSTIPLFKSVQIPSRDHFTKLKPEVRNHLKSVNRILEEYNLHFGYRTVNEMSLYVLNALHYINDSDETSQKALDYQFVQKVFPKFNGGYAQLEAPLNKLIQYFSGEEDITKVDPSRTKFPKTLSKLLRMYKTLAQNGYASFIE
ncbi:MAG: hypothetical protein CMH04_04440 [Marinovum sp.]|nr:hypothetical protein [Marinovum sp.]|tara:strand:- start:1074 stop:2630 length:1557 start_codon:yes stop_codon:yes gene_type:complete